MDSKVPLGHPQPFHPVHQAVTTAFPEPAAPSLPPCKVSLHKVKMVWSKCGLRLKIQDDTSNVTHVSCLPKMETIKANP